MSTISDKMTYLSSTKIEIANAISEKGQAISVNDPFRSYADKIRNIETGTASPDLIDFTITENGTYNAADEGCDGFSSVIVEVEAPTPGPDDVFTVTFMNKESTPAITLQTVTDVPYGGFATYTVAIPKKEGWYFNGWNPCPYGIKADTICYAQFVYGVVSPEEIQASWETIIANGGADYAIGDWKLLDIGIVGNVNHGAVRMQKVAAGESGSTSTWISMESIRGMARGMIGSGQELNWETSGMRSWLNTTFLNVLPTIIRNALKPTIRFSNSIINSVRYPNHSTSDILWIPSAQEIFGLGVSDSSSSSGEGYNYETSCPFYADVYKDAESRAKNYNGYSTNHDLYCFSWLRSARQGASPPCFKSITASGNMTFTSGTNYNAISFSIGFSI